MEKKIVKGKNQVEISVGQKKLVFNFKEVYPDGDDLYFYLDGENYGKLEEFIVKNLIKVNSDWDKYFYELDKNDITICLDNWFFIKDY